MGRIDDLNLDEIAKLKKRIRDLETATPTGFSSVSRGALRVASNEGLLVEGSQRVSGTSVVSGTQTISGTQTVTGTHNINGTQNVNGTLKIGSITIAPTGTYGGRISASTLDLNAGTTFAAGDLACSNELSSLGGLSLYNLPTTTDAANLRRDAFGIVRMVTSASRFKIDPQPMNLPEDLLAVPVEAWVDRSAAETIAELWDAPRPFTRKQQAAFDGASLKRIPGVIAEKVEAAGGEAFVSYGADGEIEGVAYDRLAVARTAILARKLDEAMRRIDVLEKRVSEPSQ